MRNLLLAAVSGLLTLSAVAQDDLPAKLVAESSDGSKWFVRTDRIARSEWAISVWLYVYPSKPTPVYKNASKPTYNYQVTQWSISCKGGTYTIGKSAFYTMKGEFLDEAPPQPYPHTPTPDTVADAVVLRVCDPRFPGD